MNEFGLDMTLSLFTLLIQLVQVLNEIYEAWSGTVFVTLTSSHTP